jgi:hypothetical protein
MNTEDVVERNTGWCLRITADPFAVRFVCGLAHLRKYRTRRTQKEKSAVAFLAGLSMGFAWYQSVGASWLGPQKPEGQGGGGRHPRSQALMCMAYGMGHGAVSRGCCGSSGAAHRERRGPVPRCLASNKATSGLACRYYCRPVNKAEELAAATARGRGRTRQRGRTRAITTSKHYR